MENNIGALDQILKKTVGSAYVKEHNEHEHRGAQDKREHKTRDMATPSEQEQHSLRKRRSTRKENQHRLNSTQNKYTQINTLNNKQNGTTAQYTQTETRSPESREIN